MWRVNCLCVEGFEDLITCGISFSKQIIIKHVLNYLDQG